MTHEILPTGNLKITASPETLAWLREQYTGAEAEDPETMEAFCNTFESLICNSELQYMQPQYIGALVGDPFMLGIFGQETPLPEGADPINYHVVGAWENAEGVHTTWYQPVEKAWWFPQYAMRSPLQDILAQGYVIFENALEN